MRATYTSMWNNFPNGVIASSHTDTGSAVVYTRTLLSGQTITTSMCPLQVTAQFNLQGTAQPSGIDTYQLTTQTSAGQINILSGYF